MAKNNMGIADSEFKSAARKLSNYAEALDSDLKDYLNAVRVICEEAIQDQLIRSRLSSLADQVESLRGPLNSIVSQASKDCKTFVKEIDKADQFLY